MTRFMSCPGKRREEQNLPALCSNAPVWGAWFHPCQEIFMMVRIGSFPDFPDAVEKRYPSKLVFSLTEGERDQLTTLNTMLKRVERTLKSFVWEASEEKFNRMFVLDKPKKK